MWINFTQRYSFNVRNHSAISASVDTPTASQLLNPFMKVKSSCSASHQVNYANQKPKKVFFHARWTSRQPSWRPSARLHKSKPTSGNKVPLSLTCGVWIKPRFSFHTLTKNNTHRTNSILHFLFSQNGQFRLAGFSVLLKRGLREGQRPGGLRGSVYRSHSEMGRHRLAQVHHLSARGAQRDFERWEIC